jgi:hypothetical protein
MADLVVGSVGIRGEDGGDNEGKTNDGEVGDHDLSKSFIQNDPSIRPCESARNERKSPDRMGWFISLRVLIEPKEWLERVICVNVPGESGASKSSNDVGSTCWMKWETMGGAAASLVGTSTKDLSDLGSGCITVHESSLRSCPLRVSASMLSSCVTTLSTISASKQQVKTT